MTITTATRQAAKVQPAQVGNGRTAHYVTTEHVAANALCDRTVSRVLDDEAAAKMTGECTRCVKAVEQLAADATPAPTTPTAIKPLPQDVTTPATMFDPELTYYADGTPVVMRWTGGEKSGTTAGMTVGRRPYAFQAVTFEDGTTSNVAPHALHRAEPATPRYTAEYETVRVDGRAVDRITVRSTSQDTPVLFTEFPWDPDGNAGNNLAGLGWTITGMQAYGGPTHFHAHVEPSAPAPTQARRLMPDQARGVVITTFPQAQDFQPLHDRAGRFLGYTFQSTPTRSARFGWITNSGSYSKGLEQYRFAAELLLPAAVLEDQRAAQCTAPAADQRAAALAARQIEETRQAARYRADTDDRIVADARRYGGTLAQTTADRIADRHQAGPFKSGDRIVCPDEVTRTVQAMAPTVAGEPDHVIVDGGAQWIAGDCRHAAEPPFHGPLGYKGPRALCGYADHIAPTGLAGNMAVHERTAGTIGTCPGSLLAPRAHREELTRTHTTAYSHAAPRPTYLAYTGRQGDVIVVDGQERTVQDVTTTGTSSMVVTFADDTAEAFTLEDRLVYRRRVRTCEVPCQECGVTVTLDADEATDGTLGHRLCGVCDHPDATDPEHRAAVLEEATARLSARASYSSAHGFQPVAGDGPRRIGWTFRTGYGAQARYGWVTCLGRLTSQVGTEYRMQSEAAVIAHHEAGTLAPTGHDLVNLLAERPLAEIRLALEALQGADDHDGATWGCSPRHAEHPDVIAARRALDGLSAARLTDHHGESDLTELEQEVHGYVAEPRGQGRVALYWMEGGKTIQRNTPEHGAALDCLADRMRREGWATEPLRRTSPVLFVHVPRGQRQG